MLQCPTCKGEGIQTCEVHELGKEVHSFETTCVVCDGDKEITEELAEQLKEQDKLWCRCTSIEYTFGSYPEDGECNCGVHKHHVHCGTCGKISQIG